jgi:glycosyltransferase involved in cell wall biosynthesis
MIRTSSPKTLNVLHVAVGLTFGGLQEYLLGLFKGMDRERFRLIACAIENPKPAGVGKEILDAGFEVICLGMKRKMFKTILELGKIIRTRNIHILHAVTPYPSFYGRLAGVLYGVPVLISHAHMAYERKRWNRVIQEKLLSNVTDMHVGVSGFVARQIIDCYGVRQDRVRVIYNGVDTKRFCPPSSRADAKRYFGFDPERPVVGMVARPDPVKGHRYFFEAVKLLEGRFNAQYYVAGADQSHPRIREEAEKADVISHIRFLGVRRDVPDLLGATDIFVLPTLSEALGISILEAMATCCAVVVSDVPVVLEILKNGENGLVTPMRDSVALAERIGRLLKDPDLRLRLGTEGRKTVEARFSLEKCIKETADLYEYLWARKAGETS